METKRRYIVARADGRRQRHLRRRLRSIFARVAVVTALLVPMQVNGIVSRTITIDGATDDWAIVLSDPANSVADVPGDGSLGLNRDLTLGAATWDTSNLYFMFRRASSSGGASYRFQAYVDVNGDGLMSSVDRVVYSDFGGAGGSGTARCVTYTPANAAGDPLGNDQGFLPGTLGNSAVSGSSAATWADSTNIVAETRVNWAGLGVPEGSPVRIKFACGQTNGNMVDTSNQLWLVRRAIELDGPQNTAADAGSVTTIPHVLTNSGNNTETIALGVSTDSGWSSRVKDASENTTAAVTLGPQKSVSVYLEATVPSGTPDGTSGSFTLNAACVADGSVRALVTDRVYVGPLLVVPDNSGYMAPGSTVTYLTNVRNNSSMVRSVEVTAASSRGWDAQVYEIDGVTPVSSLTLNPYATVPLVLKVKVPPGTSTGIQDTTMVHARLSSDPTVYGDSHNLTEVRPALEVTPNFSQYAGEGGYAFMKHTVRNSWPTTRTVSLSAASVRGWPLVIYDSGGVNTTTTVTLGPNGAKRDVIVREAVPAGTAAGTVDTVTVTATAAPHSATATDKVTVTRLATYDSGGFSVPKDTFVLGQNVYARAMGFNSGQTFTFRWTDASSTVVSTQVRTADAQGTESSFITIGANAPVGIWRVDILVNGVVTESTTFKVDFDAMIWDLTATDAPSSQTTSTITGKVRNKGAAAITNTTIDYTVWWDTNANAVFDAGDLYVTPSSTTTTYTGGAVPVTRSRTGLTAPPNTTVADTWYLSNAQFDRGGTYHVSMTWRLPSGFVIDARGTTFYSSMSLINMTVAAAVDFGSVVPSYAETVPLSVVINSPKTYDLTTTYVNASALGITTTLGSRYAEPSGLHNYTDNLSILVPWAASGPKTAQVVYTVVLR